MKPVGRFEYDEAERWVDGAIHVTGVLLASIGAVVLFRIAWPPSSGTEVIGFGVYAIALLSSLLVSAIYNMCQISDLKWRLRRLDHALIYFLIAGTYSPFVAQIGNPTMAIGLGISVWSIAIIGAALKFFYPGRYDRLSIALYLFTGWLGILVFDEFSSVLPGTALVLIVAGGALYTVGVIFHLWERLRFQNAIWHGFVLVASICFYGAVLSSLMPTA